MEIDLMMEMDQVMYVQQLVHDAGMIAPYLKDRRPLSRIARMNKEDVKEFQLLIIPLEDLITELEYDGESED